MSPVVIFTVIVPIVFLVFAFTLHHDTIFGLITLYLFRRWELFTTKSDDDIVKDWSELWYNHIRNRTASTGRSHRPVINKKEKL